MALTNPDLLRTTATASETTEGNWHSEELEEVLICLHRLQQTTSDGMVRSSQMLEDERCRLALEALCPRREPGQALRPAAVGTVLRKHRGRKALTSFNLIRKKEIRKEEGRRGRARRAA